MMKYQIVKILLKKIPIISNKIINLGDFFSTKDDNNISFSILSRSISIIEIEETELFIKIWMII